MRYENIVDPKVVDSYFLKLPYGAVSAVKESGTGIGAEKIPGRTSFLVGHAGARTQNGKFHHLT